MRIPGLIVVLILAVGCGSPATPPESEDAATTPDVRTRDVTYTQNGTTLTGLLAWDENATGQRPGVLVVHEWWGPADHPRSQARRLAEAGYVAFALDMYGDGRHAMTPDEAAKLAGEATQDPAVVAARFDAGRDALTSDPHVDPSRIAAIGYCFGGMIVLEMARAGMDLDAVVSFHGLLDTQSPARPGQVKAPVLVLTGGADPFAPPDSVEAFRNEMTTAAADFRVVTYPNAKHGFTNPAAAEHGMPEVAYDAEADAQSWQEMLTMFEQVFGA